MPSDAAVYLANKTLKSIGPSTNGEYLNVDTSTSAFTFRGGVSGGSIATFMAAMESVPKHVRREAGRPYITSPIVGVPPPPTLQFLHRLFIPGMKPLLGAFFVMGPGNTALVQRSYGLLELHAKTGRLYDSNINTVRFESMFQTVQNSTPASDLATRKEAVLGCYGSKFKYTEFQVMSSIASVVLYTAVMVFGVGMLLISPVRP